MKEIGIEKVTLNIGIGKPGKELNKGKILLKQLTGMEPSETRTMKRIPGWSLRPNLVIGTKVTMRGEGAHTVLKALLEARDFRLMNRAFDKSGNFSFGIKEYLDIPTLDYIPEVGIMGLEVAVTLQRKGYRVKRRALLKRAIPTRHKVSQEDAITFAQEKLNVHIVTKEELEE